MESEDYIRINEDLDEGKTCCLCCGLEQGYNMIGVLTLVSAIYSAMLLSVILEFGSPLLKLIFGIIFLWCTLIAIIWL